MSTFSDFRLDHRLEKAVQVAGYEKPTPIQKRTIPIILKGKDLIGTAQTGTGKTAAFVLPLLHSLMNRPNGHHKTRALIIAPTRELAEQTNNEIRKLSKFCNIRSVTVYGGVGMDAQERGLRKGVEVVVACPGRLIDHIERGTADLSRIEILVLDEADRMLDMGFLPSIKTILKHLPVNRQTMLFSATIPDAMSQLTYVMKQPERIDIDLKAPAKTVAHALYPCPQHLKTSLLLTLLDGPDTTSVLVFTRTRRRADRLAQQIDRKGFKVTALHSDKTQNQRQRSLDDFRRGHYDILVATDIAARGLDIADVTHVINYDVPDTADTYIHRIGRTGRAEREGDAMTLVTDEDSLVVRDIERSLGTHIERRALNQFDYTKPAPAMTSVTKRPPQQSFRPRRGGHSRAARR